MSDIIRLLPESIANQIAAGEVVPAPAYVIKELLENSIDAEATRIDITLEGAGRLAIMVSDNGKGMSPTDARMAFERHATSKLRQIEDLDTLMTMGFRGEALAAIASVCQVELLSRVAENEIGTELHIDGARVTSQTPAVCPVGTTIKAMNIFYNTPGRRKHIYARKESTELIEIWRELAKVALANPQVAFSLRGAGKYDKILPVASLKERIIGIGGNRMSKALIPLNYDSNFCSIHGFIGTPSTAVKSGAQQYLFVNNRFIRHPYFHKAITLAYEKFIPAGTQPHYFLYFSIPADRIDVNIHPQKTDVRFLDEATIFPILQGLIREAFSAHALTPMLDFDNERNVDIPAYQGRKEIPEDLDTLLDQIERKREGELASQEGLAGTPTLGGRLSTLRRDAGIRTSRPKPVELNWDDLGEKFDSLDFGSQEANESQLFPDESELLKEPSGVRLSRLGQRRLRPVRNGACLLFQSKYLVTTLDEGLALIDITRAQLRILYDQYLAGLKAHSFRIEQPLFPEELHFSTEESAVAAPLMESLSAFGFRFEAKEPGTYVILEAPSIIAQDAQGFVQLIVADSVDTHRSGEAYVQSFLAEIAAESEALRLPTLLGTTEQEELVNNLLSSSDPYLTPSGRKIIVMLSEPMVSNYFT